METLFTVYRLWCVASGKSYIGQTCEPIGVRLSKHKSDYKNRYDGRPLHLGFDQYGTEGWEIETLERDCTASEALMYEIDYITKFNSLYGGYNGNTGGFGTAGRIWSEEQKLKLSDTLKRYWGSKTKAERRRRSSDETKKLMSNAKLKSHWRSESCVVNGISFKSLRQAAIEFSITIYKVKNSIEFGTEIKHGNVDWDKIIEDENKRKEKKYIG